MASRGAFSSRVAVCYADDLVLLPLSSSALRIMIHCCKYFAGYRGLRFNASKIQVISVSHSQFSNCHACTFSVVDFFPLLILSHTLVMFLVTT